MEASPAPRAWIKGVPTPLAYVVLASALTLSWRGQPCLASRHSKRLYDDLFVTSGYNRLIRPVQMINHTVHVNIGLQLMQIIDVVSY